MEIKKINDMERKTKKQKGYWAKYNTEERKKKFKERYNNNKLELKLKREQEKGKENITIDDIEIYERGRPKLPEELKQINKKNYTKLQSILKRMEKIGVESEEIKNKVEEYEQELTRRHILKT